MDDPNWELYKTIGGWLTGGAIGACITLTVTWFRGRRQRILVGKTVTYMDVSKVPGAYDTKIIFQNKAEDQPHTYSVNLLAILRIEFKNPSNKDFPEFTVQVNIDKKHRIIAVEHVGNDKLHNVNSEMKVSITEPTDEYKFHLKPFNRKDSYITTFLIDAKDRDVFKGVEIGKDQPVKFIDANLSTFRKDIGILFFGLCLAILASLRQKSIRTMPAPPTDALSNGLLISSMVIMFVMTIRRMFRNNNFKGVNKNLKRLFFD